MKPNYGQCSLFLHPSQHDFAFRDISPLISVLQDTGLISLRIDSQPGYNFYTGKRFLDYVAYMGCAPTVQFEASDNNDNFCFIKIHQYQTAQLIFSQTQSRAPHCPHCKKPVSDWQQNKTVTSIRCNSCKTSSNIENYNWRKMAGYASLFIEITDIFPKEAIPQQSLLDKLSTSTNTDWQYFYSCQ